MKKGFGFFLIVIFALLAWLLSPSIGRAQDTERWSRPVSVSGFLPGSWFPALAVDSNGDAHATWAVTQGEGNDVLYYGRWDGLAWSRPVDIQLGGSRSALAVDRGGLLHLVYVADTKGIYERAPIERAAIAQAWSSPHVLNTGSGNVFSAQIGIDSHGTVHLVWTESTKNCTNCYQVLYTNSTDGGTSWSAARALNNLPAARLRVQLDIDDQDVLRVVWDGLSNRGRAQSAVYTFSTDYGTTWAQPKEFLGTPPPSQTTIGTFGANHVMLIWRALGQGQIFFQTSTDNGITWSGTNIMPGISAGLPTSGFDRFATVTDSSGTLHLAAVGQLSDKAPPTLYHLTWDGKAWSKPTAVYDGPDFPEFPNLALSGGNRLHLAWFTRGHDNITGPPDDTYHVWYIIVFS